MPVLKINGQETEFEQGLTVLQVCEQAGVEIPRFCYHERLEIAGNCRMCLVEIKGGPPKPAASCAINAAEGMDIHTDSPMVKKAREGVMEFLLINHPLDCPICDQGGECDLQDQAMTYGRGGSRYEEHKRAVKDKYMGPLIKTHMTRCIHCTRCVRFMDEVAGVHELGAVSRGENMQITTYVEQSLHSELSGNIVDLCPVGALTSRPYAFRARPWELRKTETHDVTDSLGSAIRVDAKGREVLRILPRLYEEINEEWISDKTRHVCDGLKVQRLDRAYIKYSDGTMRPAGIAEGIDAAAKAIGAARPGSVGFITGRLADMQTQYAAKILAEQLNTPHIDCRFDGTNERPEIARGYRLHVPIEEMENADAILLIGTDPRKEAALLNARIRKAFVKGAAIGAVGARFAANYDVTFIGDNAAALQEVTAGKHPFAAKLRSAKRPLILVGGAVLARRDADAVIAAARAAGDICESAEARPEVNILYDNIARVGGLYADALPKQGGYSAFQMAEAARAGELDVIVLCGVDEYLPQHFGNATVIYLGHHGEAGAALADIMLPAAAYTEKTGFYMNNEGRLLRTAPAVQAPGEALPESEIICAVGAALFSGFPNAADIEVDLLGRCFAGHAPFGEIAPAGCASPAGSAGACDVNLPLASPVTDFYRTDVISRHSVTLAACSKAMKERGSHRPGKAEAA